MLKTAEKYEKYFYTWHLLEKRKPTDLWLDNTQTFKHELRLSKHRSTFPHIQKVWFSLQSQKILVKYKAQEKN